MNWNIKWLFLLLATTLCISEVELSGSNCDKFCKRAKRRAIRRSTEKDPSTAENFVLSFNRVLTGYTGFVKPNSDLVSCVKTCLADNTCYSFDYHLTRRTCLGNTSPFNSISNDQYSETDLSTQLDQYYSKILHRNKNYLFFRRKLGANEIDLDWFSKRGAGIIPEPNINWKSPTSSRLVLLWEWASETIPKQINVVYSRNDKLSIKNSRHWRASEGGSAIIIGNAQNATLKGLSPGECYTLQITFITIPSTNENITSKIEACTRLPRPSRPSITSTGNTSYVFNWKNYVLNKEGEILISWIPVSNIARFPLSRKTAIIPGDRSSYSLHHLLPLTRYMVYIQAQNQKSVSSVRSFIFTTRQFDIPPEWLETTTIATTEIVLSTSPHPPPPPLQTTRSTTTPRTTTTSSVKRPTTTSTSSTTTSTTTTRPTTTSTKPTTTTRPTTTTSTRATTTSRLTTTTSTRAKTTTRPTTTTSTRPTSTTRPTPITSTRATTTSRPTTTTSTRATTTSRPTTTTSTRPTTTTTRLTTTTMSTTSRTTTIQPSCEIGAYGGDFIEDVIATSKYWTYTANQMHLDGYGWMPNLSNLNQFINTTFSEVVPVKGFSTQGVLRFLGSEYYVTEFEVRFSRSLEGEISENLYVVEDAANSATEPTTVYLPRVIFARRLSIHPLKWNHEIALRMDILLEC